MLGRNKHAEQMSGMASGMESTAESVMLAGDRGAALSEPPEPRRSLRTVTSGIGTDPWRDLGFAELANTIRSICTQCGWTKVAHGQGQTLAVTSALEREGKTAIAQAVAITMAQDHHGEVLLIECDLLHPNLHRDFAAEPGPGLGDVLSGVAELDDALRPTAIPNLWVLPAGSPHGNPSRLLRSTAMTALLDRLRERFAFTVLDLPAVLKSNDSAVLARQAEGTVLIVRSGVTDRRAVQQALHLLSGAYLHGLVLNRWRSAVPDIVRRLVQV